MNEIIAQFTHNNVLVAAFWGWISAQIIKTLLFVIVNKEFVLERLVGDGGMPSSHSATVMAMVVATAHDAGITSAVFGVAAVMAIVVMHDAMGVRRETGKQAVVINDMMEYFAEIGKMPAEAQLKEFVGHTPFQVIIGAILGTVVGFIVCGIII